MGYHATERLNWMVSSDLRPLSHQRSSCRRLPPCLLQPGRASLLLTAPGCLLIRLKNGTIGCFFTKSGESQTAYLPTRSPLGAFSLNPGKVKLFTYQLDPQWALFHEYLGNALLPTYLLAIGLSLPLSSRSARVQRAARSRLCVTRIDVSP